MRACALLCATLLVVCLGFGQDAPVYDVAPSIVPGISPASPDTTPPGNWPYPLKFNWNYSTMPPMNGGTVGAMYFGGKYILNRWNSTIWYRFNPDGPGGGPGTFSDSSVYVGAIRDLAAAYGFLWGGAASTVLYKLDANGQTIASFTIPGAAFRAIAYDPVLNGFWNSNFSGNILCHDTTGALRGTIPSTLAGKYGMAYDNKTSNDSTFLWVWNQETGSLQNGLYKYHIASGALVASYIFTLPGLQIGLAGGAEIVEKDNELLILLNYQNFAVVGYKLKDLISNPLSPFNLQTPAAGVKITTLPGSTTPVSITWDTASATATYKWIFGSPVVPPRILTLPSGTNSINTTLGALDAILAGLGVQQGDSVIGQWDVWAFRNNPTNDSLKSTNGPRAVTLKRGRPTLSAFSLVSPPTGATVVTSSVVTTPISIIWRSAGAGATYRWKFATPTFAGTIRFNVPTGLDTFATFPSFRLDSLVASLGVIQGDSIVGQWRAYAYSGTDSLASTQTFDVTFKRALPPETEPHYYNLNTGTTSNTFPFGQTAGKAVNSLFLAGEFNQPTPLPPGQRITRVYFRTSTAVTRTFTNLHILMAQDTITTLTAGTFYPGPYDTVYYSPSTTLTSTVGGWMGVTLDHPFNYDPTKSLITFVGQCGADLSGMNVYNSTLTPFRRTWSVGGCPFVPYTSGTGGDGAMINFGVGVEPAGTTYGVPELIYYKFEDNPSATATPNSASSPVGTNNPSLITGHTLGAGGMVDTCLIGAAGTGANCVLPGWNWNVTGNWTIGFWVSNLLETAAGSPTYLFGDPGSGSFRCFYGGAALPNNIIFRGPFSATGWTVNVPMPGSYYIHLVWDGTAIVIYKDGVLVSTNPATNVMPTGTGFKVAGYSTSSYALNVGGKMDEFRLYNRALGPAEIAATWNHTLPYTSTTGVEPPSQEIPVAYELAQNYPNPFNPTTTIQYGLPAAANVTLKIYNILGQEITTLVNEQKNPGTYQTVWNSRNSAGAPVASGVYFYSLVARSANDATTYTNIKKMLLLK